jgi:hypothetical protein
MIGEAPEGAGMAGATAALAGLGVGTEPVAPVEGAGGGIIAGIGICGM